MKSRLVLIAVVALAVLGAGAFWFVSTLDDQDKATVDSALADFRARAGESRAPGPGLPAQGVYEYSVKGREKIEKGITIERTLPTTATVMVFHRPGGYETETLYSQQHSEKATYAVKTDGVYLTDAVTTISAGPIATTRERAWKPQLMRFPLDNLPGWGGQYQAGDLMMTVAAKVLPDEAVTVEGKTITAHKYRFDQTASGEYSGRRVETFWVHPTSGLLVRYTMESALKGPTNLEFDVDQTVLSLAPQT